MKIPLKRSMTQNCLLCAVLVVITAKRMALVHKAQRLGFAVKNVAKNTLMT